jgi:hypothetical protein
MQNGDADNSDQKQHYAPIPARAMADTGLSAENFRVLACICSHDRFGKNGRGCEASHPRIAALARCHLKSLSRSLTRLAELGYITTKPHPLNKRVRVYSVVYDAADREIMRTRMGNETATYDDDMGSNPVTEPAPIGNKSAPIGNNVFGEVEQSQGDAHDKRDKRFCETVIDKAKPKESPAEAASPRGDAPTKGFHPDKSLPHNLRLIEAELKRLDSDGYLPEKNKRRVSAMAEYLSELHSELSRDDPHYGKVYRLCDEISAWVYV